MASCTNDSMCDFLQICSKQLCVHKNILDDIQPTEIGALILLPFIVGLSNAAGLSAALHKTVLLMLILNFNNNESSVRVYPILLGSSLINSILMFFKSHPNNPNLPLINYHLANLLLPGCLLGSGIGIIFNFILPQIALILIFVVYVGGMTLLNFVKAKQALEVELLRRKQEQQKNEDNKAKQSQMQILATQNKCNGIVSEYKESENQKLDNHDDEIQLTMSPTKKSDIISNENNDIQDNQQIDESEKIKIWHIRYPLKFIILPIFIFIIQFIYVLLTGSKYNKSIIDIETCSPSYWIIFSFQFPLHFILCFISYKVVQNDKSIDNQFQNKYKKVYSLGIAAGVLTGLHGIGSMMLVPCQVILGLHPRSSTATTQFLIFFMALNTTVISLIQNQLPTNLFLALFFISFLGGGLITLILNKIIEYYKIQSQVIFLTTTLIFIALWSYIGSIIKTYQKISFQLALISKPYC